MVECPNDIIKQRGPSKNQAGPEPSFSTHEPIGITHIALFEIKPYSAIVDLQKSHSPLATRVQIDGIHTSTLTVRYFRVALPSCPLSLQNMDFGGEGSKNKRDLDSMGSLQASKWKAKAIKTEAALITRKDTGVRLFDYSRVHHKE